MVSYYAVKKQCLARTIKGFYLLLTFSIRIRLLRRLGLKVHLIQARNKLGHKKFSIDILMPRTNGEN